MSSIPESVPPPSFLEHPELPPGIEPPRSRRPAWRPWTAWVALLAATAATLLGGTMVGAVAALLGGDFDDPSAAVNIIGTVVQDACLIGSVLLFARLAASPRPQDFGLRTTRVLPAIGWMAVCLFAFYLFTVAWVSIIGADPRDDEVAKQLGVDESAIALIAASALVTVVAPIAEEVFFRGYFFAALRNWKGTWPAAILTGLIFGAIHGGSADVAYLLPLAFFGFALCLLYERTGSLYPCIALHCLNNSLAFGVTQNWTWQIPVLMASSLAAIAVLSLAVRRWWSPSGRSPSRGAAMAGRMS